MWWFQFFFDPANGRHYLGLRQSLGGDAWKACLPARLQMTG